MKQRFLNALYLVLLLTLAGGFAACGGGSSGAAAPSGGSDSPVAVEIPALDTIGELPFASSVVVTASSNIAAAIKATPASWVYKSFTLTNSSAFVEGDEINACHYRNTASVAEGTFGIPDQMLCLIQSQASSISTAYDGNYHIVSSTFNKIKFKVARNSSNVITSFEQFSCNTSGTQESYTLYTISGTSLSATLKQIRTGQPQRTLVTLTGTLDSSARFTAKEGSMSYTGTQNSGAQEGAIDMVETATTMRYNAFDSTGSGSNVIRLYGQAGYSNSSSPQAISGATFAAGAATVIDNGAAAATRAWDANNDPTSCSGSNCVAVTGQTPKAAATQSISAFSDSQAWDCSGTAEATATDSFTDASSCFNRFTLNSEHIDCVQATDGGFSVTAKLNGTALSTSSGSPTSVSASPTIVLVLNRAGNTTTFGSSGVRLLDTSLNPVDGQVSFDRNNWNSATTELTISPSLTSGKTYNLVIYSGSSGVQSTTGDTKTMAADKNFYISVP